MSSCVLPASGWLVWGLVAAGVCCVVGWLCSGVVVCGRGWLVSGRGFVAALVAFWWGGLAVAMGRLFAVARWVSPPVGVRYGAGASLGSLRRLRPDLALQSLVPGRCCPCPGMVLGHRCGGRGRKPF